MDKDGNVIALTGPNKTVHKVTTKAPIPPEIYADASLRFTSETIEELVSKIEKKKKDALDEKSRGDARKLGHFVQDAGTRLCVYAYNPLRVLCVMNEINGCEKCPIFQTPGLSCFSCFLNRTLDHEITENGCEISFVLSSSGLVEGKDAGDIATCCLPFAPGGRWQVDGANVSYSPTMLPAIISCLPSDDLKAINELNFSNRILQAPYVIIQEHPEMWSDLKSGLEKRRNSKQECNERKMIIRRNLRSISMNEEPASVERKNDALEEAVLAIQQNHGAGKVYVGVNKGTMPYFMFTHTIPGCNTSIKNEYDTFLASKSTGGFMKWIKARNLRVYRFIQGATMQDTEELGALTVPRRGPGFVFNEDGRYPTNKDFKSGDLSGYTSITIVEVGNQTQSLQCELEIQRRVVNDERVSVYPLFEKTGAGARTGSGTTLPGMVALVAINMEALSKSAGKNRLSINGQRRIEYQKQLCLPLSANGSNGMDILLKRFVRMPNNNKYLAGLEYMRMRAKKRLNAETPTAGKRPVSPQSKTSKKTRKEGKPKDEANLY